jgi:hypothetical protein
MMNRTFPLLLLALVAAACQGEGPTVPSTDPAFAKGGIPGPPGDGPKAEYSFVYDTKPGGSLRSDCWKKSPEGVYGKTFWCATDNPPVDPTFVLQVLKDGVPVDGGEVTFARCENVKASPSFEVGTVMDWPYCGVLLKRYRRYFGGIDYKTVQVGEEGKFSVLLKDFWVTPARILAVWGMHWEYDQGDGSKPEADIKWTDLAPERYSNPPDTG